MLESHKRTIDNDGKLTNKRSEMERAAKALANALKINIETSAEPEGIPKQNIQEAFETYKQARMRYVKHVDELRHDNPSLKRVAPSEINRYLNQFNPLDDALKALGQELEVDASVQCINNALMGVGAEGDPEAALGNIKRFQAICHHVEELGKNSLRSVVRAAKNNADYKPTYLDRPVSLAYESFEEMKNTVDRKVAQVYTGKQQTGLANHRELAGLINGMDAETDIENLAQLIQLHDDACYKSGENAYALCLSDKFADKLSQQGLEHPNFPPYHDLVGDDFKGNMSDAQFKAINDHIRPYRYIAHLKAKAYMDALKDYHDTPRAERDPATLKEHFQAYRDARIVYAQQAEKIQAKSALFRSTEQVREYLRGDNPIERQLQLYREELNYDSQLNDINNALKQKYPKDDSELNAKLENIQRFQATCHRIIHRGQAVSERHSSVIAARAAASDRVSVYGNDINLLKEGKFRDFMSLHRSAQKIIKKQGKSLSDYKGRVSSTAKLHEYDNKQKAIVFHQAIHDKHYTFKDNNDRKSTPDDSTKRQIQACFQRTYTQLNKDFEVLSNENRQLLGNNGEIRFTNPKSGTGKPKIEYYKDGKLTSMPKSIQREYDKYFQENIQKLANQEFSKDKLTCNFKTGYPVEYIPPKTAPSQQAAKTSTQAPATSSQPSTSPPSAPPPAFNTQSLDPLLEEPQGASGVTPSAPPDPNQPRPEDELSDEDSMALEGDEVTDRELEQRHHEILDNLLDDFDAYQNSQNVLDFALLAEKYDETYNLFELDGVEDYVDKFLKKAGCDTETFMRLQEQVFDIDVNNAEARRNFEALDVEGLPEINRDLIMRTPDVTIEASPDAPEFQYSEGLNDTRGAVNSGRGSGISPQEAGYIDKPLPEDPPPYTAEDSHSFGNSLVTKFNKAFSILVAQVNNNTTFLETKAALEAFDQVVTDILNKVSLLPPEQSEKLTLRIEEIDENIKKSIRKNQAEYRESKGRAMTHYNMVKADINKQCDQNISKRTDDGLRMLDNYLHAYEQVKDDLSQDSQFSHDAMLMKLSDEIIKEANHRPSTPEKTELTTQAHGRILDAVQSPKARQSIESSLEKYQQKNDHVLSAGSKKFKRFSRDFDSRAKKEEPPQEKPQSKDDSQVNYRK